MAEITESDVLGVLGSQEPQERGISGPGYQPPVEPVSPSPEPDLPASDGGELSLDDVGSVLVDLDTEKAQRSVFSGVREDPDAFARDKKTADRLSLPVEAVRHDRVSTEGQLKVDDVMSAVADAPVTRDFLADETNAKLAHDDAANLSAIEKAWNWYTDDYLGGIANAAKAIPSGAVQGVGMGVRGTLGEVPLALRRLGVRGINAVFGEGTIESLDLGLPDHLDPAKMFLNIGKSIEGVGDEIRPDEQGIATDIGAGLGQIAAQITVAVLSGGASSATSLASLVGQGATIQADMQERAGADGTAGGDAAVLLGGGITALTERYGLDALLKYIPAQVKNRIFQVLAGAGSEGSQEIIEQVLQNLTAYTLYDPEQTIFDKSVLYEGGVGAAVGGIVSAMIGVGSAYNQSAKARRAEKARENLLAANDAAMQSKLNQGRDLDKAAEHQAAVMRAQGVDSIAIDAQAANDMIQRHQADDPDLAEKLGLTEDGLLEAMETGGDVEIGVDPFARHLYGTEYFADVADHVRAKPGEMTAAEAAEYQESGITEEIARLQEDISGFGNQTQREAAIIQDEVETAIRNAGDDTDTAIYAGTLMAQRYATRAERTGESALALWRADNVRITGPKAPQTVDDLSLLLDKARSGDAEEFFDLSKTPVLDLLIDRGGVDPHGDLAQELRAAGVTPQTKPGLFKRGGVLTAGNLVQAETDLFSAQVFGQDFQGYVPQDAIIEAVRRELAGQPVRTPEQQANVEAFTADIANLEALLDERGLSVHAPDAEIRAALGYDQADAISTGPDGRTDAFDRAAQFWRTGLQRFLDGQGMPQEEMSLGRDFYVLRDMGVSSKGIALSARAAEKIRADHPDVPDAVWLNLPELVADPLYVVPHRDGGVDVVVDGQTVDGEPLLVGIRDGAVRTITPQHDKDGVSGSDRLMEIIARAIERKDRVYVKDSEAAVGVLRYIGDNSLHPGPEGPPPSQRLLSRKNIRSRDKVVQSQGRVFFQPDASGYEPRGSISFGDRETLIRMGRAKDRSTFLHEGGHLFLEQIKADAEEYGGESEQLVNDWDAVKAWWGQNAESLRAEAIKYAKSQKDDAAVSALTSMSEAKIKAYVRQGDLAGGGTMYQGADGDVAGPEGYLTRAMHEQWARGAEDYFRSGQAPSVALQDAFNRFRAWLVSIYQAMTRRGELNVQFSPEVKAVMDRLLATDEEIALVQSQYDLKPLFTSAQEVGMTPAQWRRYQQDIARAAEEDKTRQLKKHLREIEREQLKWWQEESARLRENEVEPEVHAQSVYRALYGLAKGSMPDGSEIPGGLRPSRLDRQAVIKVLENEESLQRLPKVGSTGILATGREKGAHPDAIANIYGYESGKAMLLDLMNAPPMEAAIKASTEARMKAEYGDLLNQAEAVEAALESVHGDKRGEVLAMELNALRDSKDKMKVAFVRQWAKERIADRRLEEITPARFLQKERRYAREAGKALRAGDRLGAQRAKFRQLANFYMAQESYRVREEVAKSRDYLRKFTRARQTFKTIDADFIDHIKTILAAYDLGARMSPKRQIIEELRGINEWVRQQEEENGAIVTIADGVLAADEQTHYRDLTLAQYRDVVASIKNLEAQGRLAKTAIIEGETMLIDDMEAEIVERLDALPQSAREARKAHEQNPSWFDERLSGLAGFDASLRKVEFLLEKIDGSKLGPAKRYIFQVFADAEAKRNDMTKAVTEQVLKAMDTIPKDVQKRFGEKITVPELGRTFRRSDLIMMALNTGNWSNFAKMLEGSEKDVAPGSTPWTQEGVEAALRNLSKEEWDFVQTVWDSFDAMYPQVEEIYRRENGRAPEKIEAREVETPHGTYRGGYFPMMYDPSRSAQARDIEAKSALEAMQSSAVKGSVNSSMTKARTGFSAPVLLNIEALPNHIERTAHFITHYEPVRLTRKLLARPAIVRAMTNKMGSEYFDSIKMWINELAANGRPQMPSSITGKIVEAMRTNATVAIMGFSYTTMASQLLGYANTVDALAKQPDGTYKPLKGSIMLLKGMAAYLSNPAEARRKVFEQSGEMRHRLQNTDREIRHGLKKLSGKKGTWKSMQRASLMGIAGVQLYMVDMPTWLGGYAKALEEGHRPEEAVKYADSVVRTSQTAGGTKDLAAIQRERGVTTALTMFYSYFNLLYNLEAEAAGNVDTVRDIPQLAARAMILLAIPTALEAMMRNEWPEDDEDYLTWLSLRATLYGLSSVVLVRDLTGIVDGFGYSLSPLDSFGESLSRTVTGAARAFDDGKMTEGTVKALVSLFGFGTGAPATAVNRIVDAAFALDEGKDVGPYDFLIGHKDR